MCFAFLKVKELVGIGYGNFDENQILQSGIQS